MTYLPHPQCAVCGAEGELLTCKTCEAIQYCGASHQSEHLSDHEKTCTAIKECKDEFEQAIETLSKDEHWWNHETGQPRCLDNGGTPIWRQRHSEHPATVYLNAGQSYIILLMAIKTHAGTVTALDRTVMLLKAQKYDRPSFRHRLPVLFLRLGHIQMSYNIARGGLLTRPHRIHQGAESWYHDRFQDLPNFGIFEPVSNLIQRSEPSDHHGPSINTLPPAELAIIVLAKFRVMQDLSLMSEMSDPSNTTYSFLHRLPAEISGLIRDFAIETDVARSKPVQTHDNWSSLYALLDEQCDSIMKHMFYETTHIAFWYNLSRVGKCPHPDSAPARQIARDHSNEIAACMASWQDDPKSLKALQDRVKYLNLIPPNVKREREAQSDQREYLGPVERARIYHLMRIRRRPKRSKVPESS